MKTFAGASLALLCGCADHQGRARPRPARLACPSRATATACGACAAASPAARIRPSRARSRPASAWRRTPPARASARRRTSGCSRRWRARTCTGPWRASPRPTRRRCACMHAWASGPWRGGARGVVGDRRRASAGREVGDGDQRHRRCLQRSFPARVGAARQQASRRHLPIWHRASCSTLCGERLQTLSATQAKLASPRPARLHARTTPCASSPSS